MNGSDASYRGDRLNGKRSGQRGIGSFHRGSFVSRCVAVLVVPITPSSDSQNGKNWDSDNGGLIQACALAFPRSSKLATAKDFI